MSQTTRKEVLKKLQRRYASAGAEHKRKLLNQAQDGRFEGAEGHQSGIYRFLAAAPIFGLIVCTRSYIQRAE